MMYMEIDSRDEQPSGLLSSRRLKLLGGTAATALLIVVGVLALNGSTGSEQTFLVDRAEAIALAANSNLPLSQVPKESELVSPTGFGWKVESDEPLEDSGAEAEEEDTEPLVEDTDPIDEDIDSPLAVEEDENGESYVPNQLDEDVIVTTDDSNLSDVAEKSEFDDEDEGKQLEVAEDKKRRCFKNLKKCGTFRRCYKRCGKKCKPAVVRRCKAKKFCRCWCKYKGNKKLARRCVIYKRILCKNVRIVRCKRWCKKFCKNVRRCYCCPKRHVAKKCRHLCKRISYKSKCGNCRCWRKKCYKICRFYCKRK